MCIIQGIMFNKNHVNIYPNCNATTGDIIEIDMVVTIEANEVGKYIAGNCEWIAPDNSIHSDWSPVKLISSIGAYDFIIPVTLTGTGTYTIRNSFVWDNQANTILCNAYGGSGGCNTLAITGTTGSIDCTSNPSNAAIYLDGVYMNKFTPVTLTGITAGNHTIEYFMTGYNPCSVTVNVIANQTTPAYCALGIVCPQPAISMNIP